jgi:hypothetical protein
MSEENVEIVRETIARFNSDGFLPEDLFDPEVELFNIRESPCQAPTADTRVFENGARESSRLSRKGDSRSTT